MLLQRCHITSLRRGKAGVLHSIISSTWKQLFPPFHIASMTISKIRYSGDSKNSKNTQLVENQSKLTTAIASKFQIFHDKDSPVIMDVEEERQLKALRLPDINKAQMMEDEFCGLSLKRGLNGVFEIEELTELLKKDKAQDVFVASLPSDLKYVDYIVVVTGKSPRHMLAMAEFVRKVFKKKMHLSDIIPRIEGENSKDWIALDLGNIALHVFSKPARKMYDLDSLWGVGSKHDDLCNKPEDPLIALLERHSVYLGDLQPSDTLG